MPYGATTRSHPSSNEATLGRLPIQQLRETVLRPRQTVPGSVEPLGEELRTASRLLDPKEPCNRNTEHLKMIALITASDWATDQLANLDLANPGPTTDEPKHTTHRRHRVLNHAASPDKPQHARFVDARNGNGHDLPTPVVTEYHGWSCYDGSDVNNAKGVPWFPPAADLAHLSFDERLEVLRLHHDRCRRFAGDSESARPAHERIMFGTAWKSSEGKAGLSVQPQRQGGRGVRKAKFLETERRGQASLQLPTGPVDTSRVKNCAASRQRHVHFSGSPKELPPPGLVRKYTQKFEECPNSSTNSNSSDTSSDTSFKLTDTPSCSSTSVSSSPSSKPPSELALRPLNAQSLQARTEYYRQVVSGPPIPREGVTGSWINDMLRAKLHRTFGYKHCINAGIEPEMAALVAVSLDRPMVPEGVPERYCAVKGWEAELANEQEHRADLDWELEKEQAFKEGRKVIQAKERGRESRHMREPACSGNYSEPTGVDRPPGTQPGVFCIPASPEHLYGESLYPMRTLVSPLKRSGAFTLTRKSMASPRVMKAELKPHVMGI
ncbi:hypothetical protein FRC10_006427 [Ceratobasidium sp. 414]|nr:hypothetical protein FRC10_006427 [Ceratobasidium sp. 414]